MFSYFFPGRLYLKKEKETKKERYTSYFLRNFYDVEEKCFKNLFYYKRNIVLVSTHMHTNKFLLK